ncbi:hypothetical protein GCM10023189_28060 [Nibrella saemangeumensis]|uniref:CAAX prenyl protease 2/Lysostaphin resistance protein A-like domain-containing protein n=1 Tax=Nibrella saemangeumensis TaxID=1084526 RepID=A0ABP8MYE1_9BACT
MQPVPTDLRTTPEPHPLRTLLLLTGFVILGMSLGSLIAALVVVALSSTGGDTSLTNLAALLQNPAAYPNGWYILMTVQGISHACTFLLPCLAYWYLIDRRRWSDFNTRPLVTVSALGLVVLLVIAFMPFNGLIIEWNQQLKLPETLAPVEQWMRRKEDELANLTKYLTSFRTTGQLTVAMLVIAVLPAIGEELLFRGILQRKFVAWTRNVHAGIWLAAFIFSAIHVQFYGFIPRVLLGAMFGYLYAWSGNLWVPILAHFINNGFTVLMVFMYHQKLTSIDIENTKTVPLLGALVSLVFSAIILVYFRRVNQRPSNAQPYV